MSPDDAEINRVAKLLHEASLEWHRIHQPGHWAMTPYEALSELHRQKYRHAALLVINDLWRRWEPTKGGPT